MVSAELCYLGYNDLLYERSKFFQGIIKTESDTKYREWKSFDVNETFSSMDSASMTRKRDPLFNVESSSLTTQGLLMYL